MRVSSSVSDITCRARLSQVEVIINVSPFPRITLAVACPLLALYPAPSGSAARPTPAPTAKPTAAPTAAPTAKPTAAPTAAPTAVPTATPKPKEKVWIVDVPAQEEVGHWEDNYIWECDWVYQCNGCGQIFDTENGAADHNLTECFDGNYTCGSYTMISGEPYKHYTGEKYWVVDTPAQEEVGHWEYR